jgi:hypothetical protein
MKAISSYKIVDNKIVVSTPYCGVVVEQCRKWSGKFDKASGGWVLPLSRLKSIQEQIGEDQDDLVEVEVSEGIEPKVRLSFDEKQETGCETLEEAIIKFPGKFDEAIAGLPGYDVTDNCYHLGWHVIATATRSR